MCDRFGGEVPDTLEELVTLPGVGRKTANLGAKRCLRQTSFTFTHLEHMTRPKAPKFIGPAIMGSATTPACRPRRR